MLTKLKDRARPAPDTDPAAIPVILGDGTTIPQPVRSMSKIVTKHRGPAVVASLDTCLLHATRAARLKHGPVFVFDPFQLAGSQADHWSPLTEASTVQGALRVARRFAAAGRRAQRRVPEGTIATFWQVLAQEALAPMLYAAANTGSTGIEQLVAWAYGTGQPSYRSVLEQIGAHADPLAQFDVASLMQTGLTFQLRGERVRSSIEASVQSLLREYRFTRVAESANQDGNVIVPEELVQGNGTLYIVGDPKAAKLLAPLLTALLSAIQDTANSCEIARPVLFCEPHSLTLGHAFPQPNDPSAYMRGIKSLRPLTT